MIRLIWPLFVVLGTILMIFNGIVINGFTIAIIGAPLLATGSIGGMIHCWHRVLKRKTGDDTPTIVSTIVWVLAGFCIWALYFGNFFSGFGNLFWVYPALGLIASATAVMTYDLMRK